MLIIERHLPSILTFTDLPYHRTCGSAHGGFVLSHLTMCGKLFSAIPLSSVTSTQLSVSVLSSWTESSFRTSDEETHEATFIYNTSIVILPLSCPIRPIHCTPGRVL